MKGQSAVEYLATYGWMVLAVAIVSGVAYSSIDPMCTGTTSNIYSGTISLEDYGVEEGGNLLVLLGNRKYSKLNLTSINVTQGDKTRNETLNQNISAGSSAQIEIDGFTEASGCNQIELEVFYEKGGLPGQKAVGEINAPIKISD